MGYQELEFFAVEYGNKKSFVDRYPKLYTSKDERDRSFNSLMNSETPDIAKQLKPVKLKIFVKTEDEQLDLSI